MRCKHLLIPDLSKLPPALAGDIAYRLFCEPALSERRSADHDKLAGRARYHLRTARWERVPCVAGELQVYVWEPDGAPRGTVLVVHGWTSEASFMVALVEPIRRAGHRVVLFDFPAHGYSSGHSVNLIGCARAVLAVAQAYGPIAACVAHSFAGLAALLVAEGGPPMPASIDFGRIVLIACPNRLQDVTRDFGRYHKLTPGAQTHYERHLERVGHRSLAEYSIVNLWNHRPRPMLVIHSRGDPEIGAWNADDIVEGCRGTELCLYDGLGHRAILGAPPVMRKVMTYVAGR